MLVLLLFQLQPPDQWDSAAIMALMLVFVGLFICQHAWNALAADLGHFKTIPFGYSMPVGWLVLGLGICIAAGYCFMRWAAL